MINKDKLTRIETGLYILTAANRKGGIEGSRRITNGYNMMRCADTMRKEFPDADTILCYSAIIGNGGYFNKGIFRGAIQGMEKNFHGKFA